MSSSKRVLQTVILTILILSQFPAVSHSGTIAILPFEATGRCFIYAKMLEAKIARSLLRDGYKLVERRLIRKILYEQRFSSSALVNPDTAVNIGHLSGASYIIVGEVLDCDENEDTLRNIVRDAYTALQVRRSAEATFSINLVDVESGMVLYNESESFSKESVGYKHVRLRINPDEVSREETKSTYGMIGALAGFFKKDSSGRETENSIKSFISNMARANAASNLSSQISEARSLPTPNSFSTLRNSLTEEAAQFFTSKLEESIKYTNY